eukprot:symbB.v1.2.003800.t1/scaffold192.1/size616647/11
MVDGPVQGTQSAGPRHRFSMIKTATESSALGEESDALRERRTLSGSSLILDPHPSVFFLSFPGAANAPRCWSISVATAVFPRHLHSRPPGGCFSGTNLPPIPGASC